jgi:hypothetical protein
MVAMLPDSSSYLWRLCHNLGRSLGQKLVELPHLVTVCGIQMGFIERLCWFTSFKSILFGPCPFT